MKAGNPMFTGAVCASLLVGGGVLSSVGGVGSRPDIVPAAAPSGDPVLIAAGDIATCDGDDDAATAELVTGIDGTVSTLGDNAYERGSTDDYTDCYDPTWGAFKERTRPAPGNHDYETAGASGYFDYFGAAAGAPAEGWYSYDLGSWHLIVLNSNCDEIGGCDAGSDQMRWLRADLATHPTACTLAYWHHPRFSSGTVHGSDEALEPIWWALYDAGADVVLAGHEHNYERFAPQDPTGAPDAARGIREFVVGTGGRHLYDLGGPLPTSEVRNDDTFGVLVLTLHPSGYDWAFVPVAGATFTDEGSASCH